jgi:hypothetical protein
VALSPIVAAAILTITLLVASAEPVAVRNSVSFLVAILRMVIVVAGSKATLVVQIEGPVVASIVCSPLHAVSISILFSYVPGRSSAIAAVSVVTIVTIVTIVTVVTIGRIVSWIRVPVASPFSFELQRTGAGSFSFKLQSPSSFTCSPIVPPVSISIPISITLCLILGLVTLISIPVAIPVPIVVPISLPSIIAVPILRLGSCG